MTDKGIEHRLVIGGNWFKLIKSKRSPIKLDYYLEKFNEGDYWVYKSTGKQRLVGSEWVDFEYSGYIFFKKDIYKREEIDTWIEFIWYFNSLCYLSRPFPPIEIMQKIKVINDR